MPVISATSTSSVKRNDNGVSFTRTSVTSSVTSLSSVDLKAIAAFEDAIIKGLDLTQNKDETRSAFIGRCLLAKGTAALSIAVKGPGGVILWHKAYGVKRNSQALAKAAKEGLKEVKIPEYRSGSSPAEIEEYIQSQTKAKKECLQHALSDTPASIGFSESSPLTFATCFQAASISKPMTAMACMRLVQRGELDLDTDIHEYLGDVWKLPVALPEGVDPAQPTTLRRLFGHAAGTNVSGFGGYNRKQVREGALAVPSVIQILNGEGNSGKLELNCLPNTVPQYSGGGTTIAQLVIETVTGKPLAQVIDEEIVQPLGLRNTSITLSDSPNGGDFACGHAYEECLPVAGGYHLYPEAAAAGVWTTPLELVKIQDALYKSIRGEKVNGAEFLAKELALEMVTPQFPASRGACAGVGWFVSEKNFSHSGGNEGFVCDTFTSIESGEGISWMASDEGNVFSIMEDAVKAMSVEYGGLFDDANRVAPSPKKSPPASLADCIGTYSLVSFDKFYGPDLVKPVIRVEKGDKEDVDLTFFFESLTGGVSSKRKGDSDDAFTFKVLERMEGEFTVRENGETWFSFSGNYFAKVQ
ncbi:beta-lactamase/transpeptidase-like protein [Obelidium mucronatum]|nr:beta-lactamase/transpeptidase-like protein [Obelidium mucronatum]